MEQEIIHALTIEDLRKRIKSVVLVEDLTIQSNRKNVYPAVLFNWRLKDPYANNYNAKQDVKRDTITAVCPAVLAKYAQYFYEEDYGEKWLAYEYK